MQGMGLAGLRLGPLEASTRSASSRFLLLLIARRARGTQQAAADFTRLVNAAGLGNQIKELIAACWESIAVEQWRSEQIAAAERSLVLAEKYATGDARRRIAMDRAAISITGWARPSREIYTALAGRLGRSYGIPANPEIVRLDAKDVLIEPATLKDTALVDVRHHFVRAAGERME
jgi:hypothetical protein